MKPNCDFAEIAEVLRERQRFVVMSHFRPDGDALGCPLALGLCLRRAREGRHRLESRRRAGEVPLPARLGDGARSRPPEPQEFEVGRRARYRGARPHRRLRQGDPPRRLLDQSRSPRLQRPLRRPRVHRSAGARVRARCCTSSSKPEAPGHARHGGQSFRRPSRPIPAPFNTQARRRALTKWRRS